MIKSQPERASDPRSAAAALLSFLFPGLGQAYNGQWALASLLAVPVLLIVVLAVLALALGGSGVLSRLLDSRVLVALIVLDLALLGWRLVAILQAHGDRARLSFRTGWPIWVTSLLVLVTLGMHALPAYYAAKAIDTLGSVALEGGGALFDEHQGRDVVIPVPSFQPETDRGERVTVLLIGIDFLPGRAHHLTDTMLVATVDPETNDAAMISVPRDLYGVPLPDGRVYNAKLNSLLAVAASDPAGFPLGGPATLKGAIGELLGTRIHYFAAVDIEGMKRLVDAVGGVDVMVERPIDDPTGGPMSGGFHLDAGLQHLDGELALAYARSRKGVGENDFTRAERQQTLLTAIGSKLAAGNLLVTLPQLLDAVKSSVATDIPGDRISQLARVAQGIEFGDIARVVLAPPDYVTPEPFSAAGYILHPELDAIRALGRRIFGTEAAQAH